MAAVSGLLWGIVGLALVASLLMVIFLANTTRLIPLYAIGVFMSFTLSQTGMVVRWNRVGKMHSGEKARCMGLSCASTPTGGPNRIVNGVAP